MNHSELLSNESNDSVFIAFFIKLFSTSSGEIYFYEFFDGLVDSYFPFSICKS